MLRLFYVASLLLEGFSTPGSGHHIVGTNLEPSAATQQQLAKIVGGAP
jgi:hypothetical protein